MIEKPLSDKNSEFFKNVWDVARLIPEGRVTSYGLIANYLGSKQSSRMVGWAMNAAHKFADIPAHRVVNRVGLLTGKHHFAFEHEMQTKLEMEGLEIKNNAIVNFENHVWNPSEELEF